MDKAIHELSDQQLLNECRKNNLKAYDILFHRYSRRLHHYGSKYLRDERIAEEKMMDVLVWVWENRFFMDEDVDFERYVFKAMKNALTMEIRKRAIDTVPLEELGQQENSDPVSADSGLLCKEIDDHYLEKLNGLSPQRRLAFLMSREEGLSHAAIARELNLSVHTVKNHIKAALAYFRNHLQEFKDVITLAIVFLLMR